MPILMRVHCTKVATGLTNEFGVSEFLPTEVNTIIMKGGCTC